MRFLKTGLPVFLLVAAAANSAFAAGGLIQSLPKASAWVKYNIQINAVEPQVKESTGTLVVKLLGRVTENGEVHRWVEIEMNAEEDGKKQHSVLKALIREKDLQPNAKTSINILRGWQLLENGETKVGPKELAENERSPNGHFALFIRTQIKNETTVKKAKTIDYQKGQLKMESARTGDVEVSLGPNAPAELKNSVKQTVWNHKSIPTGTAAITFQVVMLRKDVVAMKVNMKLEVQDFGNDAKSALPDKK